MKTLITFIRSNFLAGLAIFIPFIITIYLVIQLGTWFNSFVDFTPARFIDLDQLPKVVSDSILFLVALCFFVLAITILGVATKNLLGKFLLSLGEKTISKIPLANSIFSTTKQISKIVFSEGGKNQQVVLVEYPRKGSYCLGFATQPIDSKSLDKIPVFVPTSPNPSSGFLVFFEKSDLKELSISADDAFKLIISGGLSINESESISKYNF
ncbi:MAG: DUF502 domain-containing protein [Thermodesulfobacteriota bacterium]|nr:DUF502 domain-containing protein [Thermodesulfobacteriota bacterium]MEE2975124.1 DUF502 domain-containing protein [Thermodesulfobacteriota bacterium]|tara:strand:+ start:70656 stop:71288 length:633 start_codon:yes stop_codon:yes gene_type:complete